MKKPVHGYRYLKVAADDLRRELYVTSVGCLEFKPGQPYPSPGHPDDYHFEWGKGRMLVDFALVSIESGSGVFETALEKFACRAGDVFLLPPGAWHRYRPNLRTGWSERWVCANGEYLHRLRAKRQLFSTAQIQHAENASLLNKSLRRLFDLVMVTDAPNDLAIAAVALEIFGLSFRPSAKAPSEIFVRSGTGDGLANIAREFIWQSSHRPLTVHGIAKHLGVSRRTLERRYSQSFGHTVISDLIGRRIHRARHLLTETGMSVKEIAYSVGFGDPRRLIRNFTVTAGITPTAFRKACLTSKKNGDSAC